MMAIRSCVSYCVLAAVIAAAFFAPYVEAKQPGGSKSKPAWAMLGRDAGRTGLGPEMRAQVWGERCHVDVGSRVFDSPVITDDGMMYVGTEAGWVYKLDSSCGIVWQALVTGPVVSPAIAQDGTVLVPSGDGIQAFSPSGAVLWTFTTGAFVDRPAIVQPGIVYAPSHDGTLYALDLAGNEVWSTFLGGRLSWPAVGTDGTIYVAPVGGVVTALNPDGTIKWTAATGCTGLGSFCEHRPSVNDHGVFVGADDGLVYAFAFDGTVRWTYDTGMVNSEAGLALAQNGDVCLGSHTGQVVCLDGAGVPRWTWAAPGSLGAPVLAGKSYVVAGDSTGTLTILDASGDPVFTFSTTGFIRWGASIHKDDSIYFGTYGGLVHVLEPR